MANLVNAYTTNFSRTYFKNLTQEGIVVLAGIHSIIENTNDLDNLSEADKDKLTFLIEGSAANYSNKLSINVDDIYSEVANNIANELNSSFNSIKNHLELIQNSTDKKYETLADFISNFNVNDLKSKNTESTSSKDNDNKDELNPIYAIHKALATLTQMSFVDGVDAYLNTEKIDNFTHKLNDILRTPILNLIENNSDIFSQIEIVLGRSLAKL